MVVVVVFLFNFKYSRLLITQRYHKAVNEFHDGVSELMEALKNGLLTCERLCRGMGGHGSDGSKGND